MEDLVTGRETALGLQRLEKLAEHLEGEKLGVDRFDFNRLLVYTPDCGSVGCALGCLPILFPDAWKSTPFVSYSFGKHETLPQNAYSGAASFFGLTINEVNALFMPEEQHILMPEYGIETLDIFVTPKQVASNIRKFVTLKRELTKGTLV